MNFNTVNQGLTLVANIAVVAGIVVLALEVKQNTEAIRLNTMQSMATEQAAFNREFINPDIAGILARVPESGVSGLTDTQKIQLNGFDNSFLFIQQNLFYQHRAGMLEEELWDARHRALVDVFASAPSLRLHWQQRGFVFGDQFRRYIDETVIPEADRVVPKPE